MKTLTGSELAQAGKLLYGDQWHQNLARSLNVDSRRIPQWEVERRPIPSGVRQEIIDLLKENAEKELALAQMLELD